MTEKELLEELYIKEELSAGQIVKYLSTQGVETNSPAILRRLKKYGIKTRPQGRRLKELTPTVDVRDLFKKEDE